MQPPLGGVIDYKGVSPEFDARISRASLQEVEKAIALAEVGIAKLLTEYRYLDENRYYLYAALRDRRAQLLGLARPIEPSYELYVQAQPGFFQRTDQWVIQPGMFSDTYLGWSIQDIFFGTDNFVVTEFIGDTLNVALLGKIVGRVLNFSVGGSQLNSGGDVLPPGFQHGVLLPAKFSASIGPVATAIFHVAGGVGGGPAGIGLAPRPSPCHLPTVLEEQG